MKRASAVLSSVFAIVPAVLSAHGLPAQPQEQPSALVFMHVTVIDATGAAPRSDVTVVITGGRIAGIGRSVPHPLDAQVVNAAGKFLIPGLWDMHVHWSRKDYLPLFIANGVTGVRMMWGSPEHHQWRKEMADGALLGPRLSIASPILDGPNPIWRGSIAVGGADEGRQAVIDAMQGGADFIKVYSRLPSAAYFAIAEEANKQRVPLAGHVPEAVSAREAADAGQKSIEHMSGVLLATSSEEAALRVAMPEVQAGGARDPSATRLRRLTANVKAAQSYDPRKAAALFRRFRKLGTWQVPTLTVLRAISHLDDPHITDDPRLAYMPPGLRGYWDPKNDPRLRTYSAEDWADSRKVYAKYLELVGAMRRAGVQFLAGTDVSNPYCFPGFSLHDELSLLVAAGFTPMEALQTATLNPARYLGTLDSLGTVETGKVADLVLLAGNPLADIGNTRRIDAVIVGGRLIDKAEIDSMLANVAVLAKSAAGSAD